MASARAPRHRRVLGWAALGTLAAVVVLEARYVAATDLRPWPTGSQVGWMVSLAAPSAGAVLGLGLGAPARLQLRAQRQLALWAGRAMSHLLLGMAVALTVVALVPAMVGDRTCIDECGFTELYFAMTLGSCAAVAAVVGLVLYAFSAKPER